MNAVYLTRFFLTLLILVSTLSLVNAAVPVVASVDVQTLSPGDVSPLSIRIENNGDETIEDISLALDFTGLPFTSEGSSEKSITSLESDDEKKVNFVIKALSTATPGEYNIPYTLTYGIDSPGVKKGTIGVTLTGKTDLKFSTSIDNPIIGRNAKVSLKVINQGNGEARYVGVRIIPDGYSLLSEDFIYIGSIASDDFESASFDTQITSKLASLTGIIEYTDINNIKQRYTFNLPLTIYSEKEAIQKGIITKNNSVLYAGVVIAFIVLWLIWRSIAKRMRKKKSLVS